MTNDGRKILMLLGGIHYLIPVIKSAHEQGYYVITADYLPNNIAHQYSNEYINVSILDKEAVLNAAREKKIDGIISFGVDPGVITAAYVQEKMGLPSMGPYESVCILQNKDKFRKFLSDNGFNVPWSKSYSSIQTALDDLENLQFPLIVKPTDSAGSKGVSKVENPSTFNQALEYAFESSHQHKVIVEQYIEQFGCSSDSDCFSENGVLKIVSYSAQRFDRNAKNPFTPAAFTWPSTYTKEQEYYLSSELQRLIRLLKMNTTVYNVETRVGIDGKPYIMEVSPRGGGNRLSEMLKYATGVDLIKAAVRSAVGDNVGDLGVVEYNNHIAYIVLHSKDDGIFKGLSIDEDFFNKHKLEELDLWVDEGDHVSAFTGANTTIGTLPLMFETEMEMIDFISSLNEHIKVLVN